MSSSGVPVASPNAAPVPPRVQFQEDFFVYNVDFIGGILTAGANLNGNFQIQADSDFKLLKLAAFADIAGAAQTSSARIVPLCTIQINDSGSGRNLLNAPIPIPSLFGEGDLPFILPLPRIFKARSNVAIQVANFSVGTTYNLRLAFIGTKIFQLGQ